MYSVSVSERITLVDVENGPDAWEYINTSIKENMPIKEAINLFCLNVKKENNIAIVDPETGQILAHAEDGVVVFTDSDLFDIKETNDARPEED